MLISVIISNSCSRGGRKSAQLNIITAAHAITIETSNTTTNKNNSNTVSKGRVKFKESGNTDNKKALREN